MKDKEKTEYIFNALKNYLTCWGKDKTNILFPELRLGSGFSSSAQRYIDLFSISSNAGNVTTAYEIKASRADFIKDIKNAQKQRGARLYSDYFYYVAPKGVINENEVPLWAGLMEIDIDNNSDYFRCVVDAPEITKENPSWRLICSIVRKVRDISGTLEFENIKKENRQLKKTIEKLERENKQLNELLDQKLFTPPHKH